MIQIERPRGVGRYACLIVPMVLIFATAASATPEFGRMTNIQSCLACHSVPPKLNATGESFLARGYQLPPLLEPEEKPQTVPVSVWITGRQEEQLDRGFSERYLNRVELISGGPIRNLPMSYFIEWRLISLESRPDGTLRDRSGRFEDAFVNIELDERWELTLGQFRALNQVDVSRRLSVSEPVAFSAALPGRPHDNPRIQGLRAFAPAARSPGLSLTYQSIAGQRPSEGLFHHLTVPFVGEFSIPLTPEARTEASFELRGPPKGVFLETYYRVGLNSLGGHVFLGDDRWLATAVATGHYEDFHAALALGVDRFPGSGVRGRYSAEVEYLPQLHPRWRGGVGFRVEQISSAGRRPAYVPYFVLSGPNLQHTLLLQVEYRKQTGADAVFVDLSLLF